MREFIEKLQRRKLVRTAIVYLGAGWAFAQVVEFLVQNYDVSRKLLDATIVLLVLGFPAALILSWYHGEKGLQRAPRSEILLLSVLAVLGAAGLYRVAERAPLPGRELAVAPIGEADLGPGSVAILPFANNTEADSLDWLGPGLADMMTTHLAQLPALRVVSVQRLLDLLRQAGREETDRIPERLALDVAARSGAHLLVRGSIARSGRDVRIDVQLIDLADGTVAGAARARGVDIFNLIDSVSTELSGRLVASPVEPTELTPVARLVTGNLDAYREYQQGLRAERRFRLGEAQGHYAAAVAMDSTFALAAFRLGLQHGQAGNQRAASDAFGLAQRHMESASERDRLLMEGLFAFFALDLETAEARLARLAARYPDEKDGRIWLSILYARLQKPNEQRRVLEETIRLDPFYAPAYNQLAYLAAGQGETARADSLVRRYVALEPDEPNPLDSRGEILEMAGRLEEARESYREALEIDPGFFQSLDHLTRTYLNAGDPAGARNALLPYLESDDPDAAVEVRLLAGDTYAEEGEYVLALGYYRRAVRQAAKAGRTDLRIKSLIELAALAAPARRYEEAERALDSLHVLDPYNVSAFIVRLGLLGDQGRLEEIEELRQQVSREAPVSAPAVVRQVTRALPHVAGGFLAYYRGDLEGCIDELTKARLVGGPQGQFLLFIQEMDALIRVGRPEAVFPMLDTVEGSLRAVGQASRVDPAVLHVTAYLRGRAHEASGDAAAARRVYADLLGRIGDGAREITLMADAADRLARLESAAGP